MYSICFVWHPARQECQSQELSIYAAATFFSITSIVSVQGETDFDLAGS